MVRAGIGVSSTDPTRFYYTINPQRSTVAGSNISDKAFLRGADGDARRGTCYGHRSAAEYNKSKIAATERDEGRRVVLLHFARVVENDDLIREFVVVNGHLDLGMKVYSRIPGTSPETQPLAFTGDSRGRFGLGEIRPFTLLDALILGYQGEFFPAADPVVEEWPRTEEDGRLVFHAPPSYQGGPIIWLHDERLGDESLVYESTKTFLEASDLQRAPLLSRADGKVDVGLSEVVQSKEQVCHKSS